MGGGLASFGGKEATVHRRSISINDAITI